LKNTVLVNTENGLYTCSSFLGLSKEFDAVKYDILLRKQYFYFGVRGAPFQLFAIIF